MGKMNEIIDIATQDITSGKYGKIGSKYLSIREFASHYDISYVTAYKAFDILKENGAIVQATKGYLINDCTSKKTLCKKTLLFGVHVRDISNNFYASLCNALTVFAREKGIHLVFMSSNYDNNEKKAVLRRFIELKCDGVINLNSFKESELSDFYKIYPLPLVFFGIDFLKNLNTDFLVTDNKSSGELAAKHLLSCGAKKFIYVTASATTIETDDRFFGYNNYLLSVGNKVSEIFKFDSDQITSAQRAHLSNYLSTHSKTEKVGVFCHHDGYAANVLTLCQKRNIKVPTDVAILGYDDLPITQYATPQISSFAYDYKEIAKNCINKLIERIKKPSNPSSTVVFSTYLMIRGSTKSI